MSKNEFFKLLERLFEQVFEDEPLPFQPEQTSRSSSYPYLKPHARPKEKLPSLLATARSLENDYSKGWQTREAIFLQQAKLLEKYEDDYVYKGKVSSYYCPTYSMLSDKELRGYFAWRTQLRKGNYIHAPATFCILYTFELLNQVGTSDPMDGYRKLEWLFENAQEADAATRLYLQRWIKDYVVYYGLDSRFLETSPEVAASKHFCVLEDVQNQETKEVLQAVKALSGKWLDRSKFYGTYNEDMDTVIHRVLCRVSLHYSARCKKTMTEQFFGVIAPKYVSLFGSAIFCNPLKRKNYEYRINSQYAYRCSRGSWSVLCHTDGGQPSSKLGDLIKTIDAIMRQEYNFGHPIMLGTETKWLLKIIQEETQRFLGEKEEKKKAEEAAKKEKEKVRLAIDPARLEKIRQDAAITRDKLMVEEETLEELPPEPQPEQPKAPPLQPPSESPSESLSEEVPELPGSCPLTPQEYRLLQSLLYGGDLGWVRAEGLMLSVLVDGINEKLYDTFMDSVVLLEGEPQLIEDYTEDLKEMIRP